MGRIWLQMSVDDHAFERCMHGSSNQSSRIPLVAVTPQATLSAATSIPVISFPGDQSTTGAAGSTPSGGAGASSSSTHQACGARASSTNTTTSSGSSHALPEELLRLADAAAPVALPAPGSMPAGSLDNRELDKLVGTLGRNKATWRRALVLSQWLQDSGHVLDDRLCTTVRPAALLIMACLLHLTAALYHQLCRSVGHACCISRLHCIIIFVDLWGTATGSGLVQLPSHVCSCTSGSASVSKQQARTAASFTAQQASACAYAAECGPSDLEEHMFACSASCYLQQVSMRWFEDSLPHS
jgi:hypothetical protein